MTFAAALVFFLHRFSSVTALWLPAANSLCWLRSKIIREKDVVIIKAVNIICIISVSAQWAKLQNLKFYIPILQTLLTNEHYNYQILKNSAYSGPEVLWFNYLHFCQPPLKSSKLKKKHRFNISITENSVNSFTHESQCNCRTHGL